MNTRILAAISVAALLMTTAAQAANSPNTEDLAMAMAKLTLYEGSCGPIPKTRVKEALENYLKNAFENYSGKSELAVGGSQRSQFFAAERGLILSDSLSDIQLFCQAMDESFQKMHD
jgi:hypothetical protein